MKRISRSLIFAAAALAFLAALAATAPHQNKPFTLTLQAPKQPLIAGEAVILTVRVMNTSGGPVDIPVSGGSGNVGKIYHVHIRDARGQGAPHAPLVKPKGRAFVMLGGGSVLDKQLRPGESLTDQANVTYLYDLSRPGKYKIWIAEPFYGGPHNVPKGLVRSNSITVTVVK